MKDTKTVYQNLPIVLSPPPPPPLYKDDIIYTEEGDKATLMNKIFVPQNELDETKAPIPPDIHLPEHSVNHLSTSLSSLKLC